MTLLQETIRIIEANDKSTGDVQFVQSTEDTYPQPSVTAWCTWEEFAKYADFEYDSGYGGVEVNEYLIVVGSDWWLERHEYDGSEWWEFKQLPTRAADHEERIALKSYRRHGGEDE